MPKRSLRVSIQKRNFPKQKQATDRDVSTNDKTTTVYAVVAVRGITHTWYQVPSRPSNIPQTVVVAHSDSSVRGSKHQRGNRPDQTNQTRQKARWHTNVYWYTGKTRPTNAPQQKGHRSSTPPPPPLPSAKKRGQYTALSPSSPPLVKFLSRRRYE